MKKFLNVGLITCLMLALSGCGNITTQSKAYTLHFYNLIDNYTEIESNSISNLKDSNIHDYLVEYNSNEMFKYSLKEFDYQGNFLEDVLIRDYTDVTRCSYVYFEKKWYIPNVFKGVCDKNKAVEEINNIVNFMNLRIDEINKNKSTWNK